MRGAVYNIHFLIFSRDGVIYGLAVTTRISPASDYEQCGLSKKFCCNIDSRK